MERVDLRHSLCSNEYLSSNYKKVSLLNMSSSAGSSWAVAGESPLIGGGILPFDSIDSIALCLCSGTREETSTLAATVRLESGVLTARTGIWLPLALKLDLTGLGDGEGLGAVSDCCLSGECSSNSMGSSLVLFTGNCQPNRFAGEAWLAADVFPMRFVIECERDLDALDGRAP